ncbi:MAG: UDP-N-acetylmuramyl-tripeptide synthetase [Thermomicrobiales bacterium]|jgi:UDP-N-acetylmuramoyl-L-alanyl-D-glutamate--2,6-diaminopimelate ligase|nr:UDP-N-acetylmuramyl-tripeptide synthetase [Thermomicrobiales bacterium]
MNRRASTVRALVEALPGARLLGSGDSCVGRVVYDSRLVQPGDLFAALRGADFDGHQFVREAEQRGAVALLVESAVPTALPQIQVDDSRAALAAIAAEHFDHPSSHLGVIGITGTDGKTTTSYVVDHILRFAGARTGMVGTVAIRVGEREDLHPSRQTTPESSDVQWYLRQMVDAEVSWAILEATSHGLAMHRLDHVHFDIAAVTNITHEHLDYHGTVENYQRAKATLLERVAAESGVVVANADDAGSRAIEHFAMGAKVIRYSANGFDADLRARGVRSTRSGSTFVLDAGAYGSAKCTLPLIGEFNVANTLCAAGIALAAGVDLDAIAAALATAPPVPGRMARIEAGQPFSVVVDYAHTPDAIEKVLTLLRRLHPSGRVIAVFGSAGERDVEKRPLQGAIAARLADVSVITSEDPRFEDADAIIAQIAAGAEAEGAVAGNSLFCRSDRRDAIQLALDLARPGDCVLLAGKGHEGSIIWGGDKLPWDEAAVARELLRNGRFSEPGDC